MILNKIRKVTPPLLYDCLRVIAGRKNIFKVSNDSWDKVVARSKTYQDKRLLNNIIEKNQQLTEDQYERDGILFDKYQYSSELNANLLLIIDLIQRKNEPLNILDFGGGLGTTYRQFVKFTNNKIPVIWNIVEQKKIVEAGKENIKKDNVYFYEKIADVATPDVVIISSVLEFIENPKSKIIELISTKAKYFIIDRTPIYDGEANVLTQMIPSKKIGGSYPCWIFSEKLFLSYFDEYRLINNWNALGEEIIFSKITANYKGYFFENNE
jgi:putative methyltransferase (TIGR04325 family)